MGISIGITARRNQYLLLLLFMGIVRVSVGEWSENKESCNKSNFVLGRSLW